MIRGMTRLIKTLLLELLQILARWNDSPAPSAPASRAALSLFPKWLRAITRLSSLGHHFIVQVAHSCADENAPLDLPHDGTAHALDLVRMIASFFVVFNAVVLLMWSTRLPGDCACLTSSQGPEEV
jgi:hypothetical protein